ncbi:MAG: RNA polymerase sigma factor [Clostridia bacterium]|nr:RNA polymerase sigma factor [Clostridia bacterium]
MSEIYGDSSYRRFLQGDNTALEEIVRTYSDALIRFAYCYVKDSAIAEDMMEEAFAALLMKRRHFSSCEHFRAYLYKTVRNKCLDHLRFRKKQVSIADLENVLYESNMANKAEKNERNRTLYRCLQALPSQYSEVLYLAYIEDYKPSEICKIIKRTQKQTYNLLARAKLALKELLQKEGVSYEDV